MTAFFDFLDRRSFAVLLGLTVFFGSLETYYAFQRPLSHDEFNGVWCVVEVADGVPYVDFQPYKPVLGYYVQLALLNLAPDTWGGYLTIRLGMTYLAVGTLALGAFWLRRVFRPGAVCLAFGLLVVMTSLVEWAIEVRLDMLTALFGFVSLLLLLNRRVALAGTVAGFSFLISQKGTMYALAGGMALLACLAIHRDRHRWRDALVYAICVVLPIGAYVACWSLIASFDNVYGPTFGQQTQLHALTTPIHGGPNFYWFSWLVTVLRNPLFYLFVLWAFGILLTRGRAQSPLETMLLFYGCTVGVIALSVQQPWMYMFVLIVPTAFVMHAYLFTHELAKADSFLRRPVMGVSYVFLGLVFPLSSLLAVVHDDYRPQRQTVQLAEALLQPGDCYFAGFQVLYRGGRHETALGMVDTNTAHPVHALTSAQHAAILEQFKKQQIRFIVYTTVIDDGVPESIKKYIFRNYAPLWGNIWIYAPQCAKTESEVNLMFAGSYTVDPQKPGMVQIDGQPYLPGATAALTAGRHSIATPVRFRLILQPMNVDHLLNPAYREPVAFFWPDMGPLPENRRFGLWAND